MHTLLILHTQYKEEWEDVLFWRKRVKYWFNSLKSQRDDTVAIFFYANMLVLTSDCEDNALERLMERMK